jgi:hypothetical protein
MIRYEWNGFFLRWERNWSSFYSTIDSSLFSLLKPSTNGYCGGNSERIPIRFGQNVQSTCKYK